MKSFTIQIPNRNVDNNGTIKQRILKEVATKFPFLKWHGIHTPETEEESVSYAGPGDLLAFGINRNAHFSALNKKFNKCKNCPCYFCETADDGFYADTYDGISEFDLALHRLAKYAKWVEEQEKDPGYDFLYADQPVRIYQKFIQIGNTIIPMNNPYSILNRFKEEKKNNIINIIVNVSKTEIINNFE